MDVPFDYNRVIYGSSNRGGKYLNASWMGIDDDVSYIFGEIPLKNIFFDFIEMITEYTCSHVIIFGDKPSFWNNEDIYTDVESKRSYRINKIEEVRESEKIKRIKYSIFEKPEKSLEDEHIGDYWVISCEWEKEAVNNDYLLFSEIYQIEKKIGDLLNPVVLSERCSEAASLYVSFIKYLAFFSSLDQRKMIMMDSDVVDILNFDKIYIKKYYPSIFSSIEKKERKIILSNYFLYVLDYHPSLFKIIKRIREVRLNACYSYELYCYLAISIQMHLNREFKCFAKTQGCDYYVKLSEVLKKIREIPVININKNIDEIEGIEEFEDLF